MNFGEGDWRLAVDEDLAVRRRKNSGSRRTLILSRSAGSERYGEEIGAEEIHDAETVASASWQESLKTPRWASGEPGS